jgi:hypothetical protein
VPDSSDRIGLQQMKYHIQYGQFSTERLRGGIESEELAIAIG